MNFSALSENYCSIKESWHIKGRKDKIKNQDFSDKAGFLGFVGK